MRVLDAGAVDATVAVGASRSEAVPWVSGTARGSVPRRASFRAAHAADRARMRTSAGRHHRDAPRRIAARPRRTTTAAAARERAIHVSVCHLHRAAGRRRGDAQRRHAGAFTKLIEIPAARGVARTLMVPARNFLDGANAKELVLDCATVRAPDNDVVSPDVAELQALSGYDVGEVPFVMQAVCYYETTLDVGTLEVALRKTLGKYPMLAGRLDLQTPGYASKGVRLTNDGVPLRVVRDNNQRFENLPQDYADATRRFLDFAPWIDLMLGDAPVFTAKVTHCAGGGSVLGVCMSHAVSDGQGFIEFLVTWAKMANNEAHPLGDPVFDRSLVSQPPADMSVEEMREMLSMEGFDNVSSVPMLANALKAGRGLIPDFLRFPAGNRMMVSIKEDGMRRLRESSEATNDNEALSAHSWLALADLCGLPNGTPFEHVTVVSGRGGRTGLPDMYFGNAAIGVCTGRVAVGDYSTLLDVKNGLRPGFTKAMMRRNKYLMLTEAAFRAGVNGFDFDIMAFMQGQMCWCNNLVEIYKKLYDLDFGTGSPTLALPPELNDIIQIQCSRPDRATGAPAGANGVEMFINLPPAVMSRLRQPDALARLSAQTGIK